MNFEEALIVTDRYLFAQTGAYLSEQELLVLRAAWFELRYEEVAQELNGSLDNLRINVASALWKKLTAAFGTPTKVSKRNFRSAVEHLSRVTVIAELPFPVEEGPESSASLDAQEATVLGHPPDRSPFFGRWAELEALQAVVESCRVIGITGLSGIGKTALVSKLVRGLVTGPPLFQTSLWLRLYPGLTLSVLIHRLLVELGESFKPRKTSGMTDLNTRLLLALRKQQCLIVLDDAQVLIRSSDSTQNYSEVDLLLRQLCEEQAHSTLVLIGREPIPVLGHLERMRRSVFNLRLEGLSRQEARQLLEHHQLQGQHLDRLIESFQGNPELLHRAAERIALFLGGNVDCFVDYMTSFAADIEKERLDALFKDSPQLQDREKIILQSLCHLGRDACTLEEILPELVAQGHLSVSDVFKGVETLRDFSLICVIPGEGAAQIQVPRSIRKYVLSYLPTSGSAHEPETLEGD